MHHLEAVRNAMSHPLVDVVGIDFDEGLFQFQMPQMSPVITAKFFLQGSKCGIDVSHRWTTPDQPYVYSHRITYHSSPVLAVRHFIPYFTFNYENAVRHHFEPDDSWLVPNPYFGTYGSKLALRLKLCVIDRSQRRLIKIAK